MKNYSQLTITEKKKFWKENPIYGEIDINVDGLDSFKMYCDNDDSVVKELHWTDYRGWELTSLRLWSDLLKNNTNGTIYDVGAYSGIYSLIAYKASNQFKIYAFDIQDKCMDRLKKNVAINKATNIELLQAACTDFNGETDFFFYEEDGIMSSVASLVPNKLNKLNKKVTTIKLDDFELNDVIKLIKIDVEGAEISTLKGLKRVLSKDAPDVLIEVNNFKELKTVKKQFPRGYHVYDINEKELFIKKMNWFSKPSKHRNYLFTKRAKNDLIELFSGRVK